MPAIVARYVGSSSERSYAMSVSESKRIALFIDGAYFFYMQKTALNWWVDPKVLLSWLGEKGKVVHAFYYTGVHKDMPRQQAAYLKAIGLMGYHLEKKDVCKDFHTGEYKQVNLVCDVVLDAMRYHSRYDAAYFIAGSSNYRRLFESLQREGKKEIYVLSVPSFTSHEVCEAVGMNLINLQQYRKQLEKPEVES